MADSQKADSPIRACCRFNTERIEDCGTSSNPAWSMKVISVIILGNVSEREVFSGRFGSITTQKPIFETHFESPESHLKAIESQKDLC
jgi:hypothetical protein